MSKLSEMNFLDSALYFRDRQAGVSLVFDPIDERYWYNAYCSETKLLKELYSCEYESLEEALDVINQEFGSWELRPISPSDGGGCGSCAAK